jgi:hypothetical protein
MPRYQLHTSAESNSIYSEQDNSNFHGNRCSCRLVATDDRSIYYLFRTSDRKRFVIETHRLPLTQGESNEPYYTNETSDGILPRKIQTELPIQIQNTLDIDPPLELICVDGEYESKNDNKHDELRYLPRLLIYTRKSVFMLKISYLCGSNKDTVIGVVASFYEPLERDLHESMETSIIRIRKAPQLSAGFATISPATSFAALIQNSDTCKYSLLLHHANGTVTSSLNFAFEDNVEEDRVTDFCFARSGNGLGLFSSLSVLLLKESGDLYSASPVVFDGAIVSKALLDECHNYLNDMMDSVDSTNSAKWRHAKAASQFFIDVFRHSDSRCQFYTGHVLNQAARSAAIWPVQLQGPLFSHNNGISQRSPLAVAIENFGSNELFVGIAIAKTMGKLDFVSISQTILIPRFAFESRNDSLDIDDALFGLASLVESVNLCPEATESNEDTSSICIVRDPIVNNLLHYATLSTVYTVSTTAMRILNHRLQGLPADPVRTTAWVCINSEDNVRGIVVPADTLHGHTLIAGFTNERLTLFDVSELSYLHEFDSLFQNSNQTNSHLLLENENTSSESSPLFIGLQPLVEKIQTGLSNMGRFVGSDTSYINISPDTLAVALKTKKVCDNEIVLPILELKSMLEKHRNNLNATLVEQEVQLNIAKENINNMKKRISAMSELMETANQNAVLLAERSLAVFHTCQKLLPTITQAEYDFFQMIKRMHIKCMQMERYSSKLNDLALSRLEGVTESTISDSVKLMKEEIVQQANSLLFHEDELLNLIKSRLSKTESVTNRVAKEKGATNQLLTKDPILLLE